MWLSSPDRLGRVGTLKWASYATAAAIMLLATTIQVQALFAIASLVTLFIVSESGYMYPFTSICRPRKRYGWRAGEGGRRSLQKTSFVFLV